MWVNSKVTTQYKDKQMYLKEQVKFQGSRDDLA